MKTSKLNIKKTNPNKANFRTPTTCRALEPQTTNCLLRNKPNFHPHLRIGEMSSRAQECEATCRGEAQRRRKRSVPQPRDLFNQHRDLSRRSETKTEAIPNEKAANNCQQLSQNKPNLNKLLTKPYYILTQQGT